jgi:hypothetical protein
MKTLSQSSQWLLVHPVFLWISSILLGGAVSIFSGDIRRFLSIPPQRLSVWILKTRLASTVKRLQWLSKIEYEKVILLVLLQIFQLVAIIFLLTTDLSAEGIMLRVGSVHSKASNIMDAIKLFAMTTWGMAAIASLIRAVNDFLMCAERTEKLEAKKATLLARLEAKTSFKASAPVK